MAEIKYCKTCGKKLSYGNKSGYCKLCYVAHNREVKIQKWLETGDVGMAPDTTIRGVIREYILNSQNNRCAICGIENIWNGKPLNFILDHIDGDASNSSRENVRLICPNCDAQLPTYKSKNKHSARSSRKEWLRENK